MPPGKLNFSYMQDLNELINKTETDSKTLRTNLWLPGQKDGGGIVREFGTKMSTLLYLKRTTNKDLL